MPGERQVDHGEAVRRRFQRREAGLRVVPFHLGSRQSLRDNYQVRLLGKIGIAQPVAGKPGARLSAENLLSLLEKENKIEKDCTGGGKLKAEKGLQTNFTKGGKWKLIKDLKGYPTHREGGVDLTIGKNGVSIKSGDTQFTAKHGLVIPKN